MKQPLRTFYNLLHYHCRYFKLKRILLLFVLLFVVILIIYFVMFITINHSSMLERQFTNKEIQHLYGILHPDLYRPVSGRKLHCKVYNSSSKSILKEKDLFSCPVLNTVPPANICMYRPDEDLISDEARKYGVWEPYVSKHILDLLLTDRELGYIDIGANLGMHAIPAAVMERPVIAVEPAKENVRRMHKSIHLNNIAQYLTIVQNVIFDKRDNVSLRMEKGGKNIGGKTILKEWAKHKPQLSETVQSIHMDDLLEVIYFKKALMKIDIEGSEPQAFQFAQDLFTTIDIPYVFMEWGVCRNHYLARKRAGEVGIKQMEEMVEFFYKNNYRPTWPLAAIGGQTLERLDWFNWPWDIVWIKKDLQFTKNFLFNFNMLMIPAL